MTKTLFTFLLAAFFVGTAVARASARTIAAESKSPTLRFQQLSISESYSCGVTKENQIICWGRGTSRLMTVPIDIQGQKNISLATASGIACVISNAHLRCWGEPSETAKIPTALFSQEITRVVASGPLLCAIDLAANLVCWGSSNNDGELNVPVGLKWKEVAVADRLMGASVCGITSTDELKCWGSDRYGVQEIPTGLHHPRNLKSNGGVFCVEGDQGPNCWVKGQNYWEMKGTNVSIFTMNLWGKCGYSQKEGMQCWQRNFNSNPGSPQFSVYPVSGLPPAAPESMTSEDGGICALYAGETYCWRTEPENTFNAVLMFPKDFGVSTKFAVYDRNICFGNEKGLSCDETPFLVSSSAIRSYKKSVKEIAMDHELLCAISTSNDVDCFSSESAKPLSDQAPKSLANAHGLVVNPTIGCVLDGDRPVCWGETANVPTGATGVSQIHLDISGSGCFVQRGAVKCWGPTFNHAPPPTFREAVKSVAEIEFSSWCALTVSGRIQCWGQQTPRGEALSKLTGVLSFFSSDIVSCVQSTNGSLCFAGSGEKPLSFSSSTQLFGSPNWGDLCERTNSELKCHTLFSDDNPEEYLWLLL